MTSIRAHVGPRSKQVKKDGQTATLSLLHSSPHSFEFIAGNLVAHHDSLHTPRQASGLLTKVSRFGLKPDPGLKPRATGRGAEYWRNLG